MQNIWSAGWIQPPKGLDPDHEHVALSALFSGAAAALALQHTFSQLPRFSIDEEGRDRKSEREPSSSKENKKN